MVTKQAIDGRKRAPPRFREKPARKDTTVETLRRVLGSVKANRQFDVMEILKRH
ncbi:MAG: hypothetical protein Q7T33_07065 [Dehalococcoidia bacterium]|nr:hypothetical protein [Dehalococcoidia bacterium]